MKGHKFNPVPIFFVWAFVLTPAMAWLFGPVAGLLTFFVPLLIGSLFAAVMGEEVGLLAHWFKEARRKGPWHILGFAVQILLGLAIVAGMAIGVWQMFVSGEWMHWQQRYP